MKIKLYKLFKKYKLSIIVFLIVLGIGIISLSLYLVIMDKDNKILSYSSDNYTFMYDSSWKIKEKDENIITLNNGKKANLKIEIITLDDEYKYSEVSELIDEIIYNLGKQNSGYNLISKKELPLTKNEYSGYKLLYEDDDNQTMFTVYKESDKLVVFIYESNSDYFDILLDSVNNIIYNFSVIEEQFDLTKEISLETSELVFDEDDIVSNLITGTKNYDIASSNYHVTYSLPDNFIETSLNSKNGSYKFDNLLNGSITISTSVLQKNIYEYLDSNESVNIYEDYNTRKENDNYSNLYSSISKLDCEYEAYIYKYTYTYLDNKNENVIIVYAIDTSHIFIVKITASTVSITQKLIDNISVISFENYSSYVSQTKEDNNLVVTLSKYSDYHNTNIDEITIKISDKYKEIEDGYYNLYVRRKFGLDYNNDIEEYDYEVEYQLYSIDSIDKIVDTMSKSIITSYGEYSYFTYMDKLNVNDKEFSVYIGGYTNLSGVMFTATNRTKYYVNKEALFYKLEGTGYLVITISGNGKEIDNTIIDDITNFSISKK